MSELDFDRSPPALMPGREDRKPTSDGERRIQRLQAITGDVAVSGFSKRRLTTLERRLDKKDFPGTE